MPLALNHVAQPEPDRVLIFDTTLRDGEQAPGCSMPRIDKVRVARELERLGVDIIEAGFPAASRGDWEAVHHVAGEIRDVTVCALARCQERDISLAAGALEGARKPRLHVFLATSPIHRRYKLHMTPEQVLASAAEGVRIARGCCGEVEISAEDASRTEPDFLAAVVQAVLESGATTVNIPDTVGY